MKHLPECPLPHCDYGTPNSNCYGYEDCSHYCICNELRACEQRVLMLLKKIQIEVSDEWDTSGYSIYKDYRKEVFCRVRDALQEEK